MRLNLCTVSLAVWCKIAGAFYFTHLIKLLELVENPTFRYSFINHESAYGSTVNHLVSPKYKL